MRHSSVCVCARAGGGYVSEWKAMETERGRQRETERGEERETEGGRERERVREPHAAQLP